MTGVTIGARQYVFEGEAVFRSHFKATLDDARSEVKAEDRRRAKYVTLTRFGPLELRNVL